MRVLNILDEDRFGGPQKRVLMISFQLKRLGIFNKVLFPATGDSVFEKNLKEHEIEFRRIRFAKLEKSILGWIKYLLTFIPDIARIRGVILSDHIDLAHINNVRNIKPIIACVLTQCDFCWHITDAKTDLLSLYIFRFFSRFTTNIIYSSDVARLYYSRFIAAKPKKVIDIVPSCITLDREQKNTESSEILTILMVGNISPVKGYDRLVKLVKGLKERNVQCKFVIIGSRLKTQKKYIEKLERAITQGGLESYFEFKGFQNPADFYGTSDYFVCLSRSESSPVAVWEAANKKLPIISTDVGDVKYILQDAVKIISGESPQEFENALADLQQDHVKRHTVKKAKHLVQQLSVVEVALKTKTVYERILK